MAMEVRLKSKKTIESRQRQGRLLLAVCFSDSGGCAVAGLPELIIPHGSPPKGGHEAMNR